MEDGAGVEQRPPARWAPPAVPSNARQQRDDWTAAPERYGPPPPPQQHYYAAVPNHGHQFHPPPPHAYYHHQAPYLPAGRSAPSSMYHLPPLPSPPVPGPSSSSAPPGPGEYYSSNPALPPTTYDWSAPLPPIRLAPPSLQPYSRDRQSSLHAPYLHSPSQISPPPPSTSGSASISGSSTRDGERSAYGDGSSQLGVNRSSEQWSRHDGEDAVSRGEQEQFDSSVLALRSLAKHASEAATRVDLPPLNDEVETQATPSTGKGKGKDVKPKTYASSDSDPGETNANGQKVKKRKRRRKATEEPRDAANRKFMCQTCKKLFARPSALATHERSHSKAKPHVCPFPTCRRPFAVPSNLRRHQRVYGHQDPALAAVAGPSTDATASDSVDPSPSPNLESAAPVSPLPLPASTPQQQQPPDGSSATETPVVLSRVQ